MLSHGDGWVVCDNLFTYSFYDLRVSACSFQTRGTFPPRKTAINPQRRPARTHVPDNNTPSVWQETLELYVAGVLKGLLAFDNATAHSYTELLVRYRTSFHNYSVGMHYGSNLFKYLDRHWINTNHCETGVSPKEGVSGCSLRHVLAVVASLPCLSGSLRSLHVFGDR